MDYETAMLLKPAIVGRSEYLSGDLAEAAQILQANGEIDLGIDGPDRGQAQFWYDCTA